MLLPPFGGVPLAAYDKGGSDITATMFAPSGFMKVDADYTPRPYEEWQAADWPKTYLAPGYENIFAVGIAFVPPHQISRPRKSSNGTVITPSPPRTGMPSGVMGKTAGLTMMPIVPDYSRFPTGRDLKDTRGKIGRSGHWVKLMLHYLFIHKAKGRFGWHRIPE